MDISVKFLKAEGTEFVATINGMQYPGTLNFLARMRFTIRFKNKRIGKHADYKKIRAVVLQSHHDYQERREMCSGSWDPRAIESFKRAGIRGSF